MPAQETTPAYLKAFTILFFALLLGQLLFALIAFVLVFTGSFSGTDKETEKVFVYMVPLLQISLFIAAHTIFKKRIEPTKAGNNLPEKLAAYRALYILRFALIEGATLFAIIAYLVTGVALIGVFIAIGILSFLTLKPSKEKLVKELELGTDEMEQI
ncbi:MAG TPA: hypothetical protein PLP23_13700 [Panacibacter sp.]|nr:hypothetical protein [Panacibacter sp.]